MITTAKEKKRRGLSMIVNQFSGESRKAESASVRLAIRESRFQKTEVETLTLTTRLNGMIAAGVSFEIVADDFQAFGASERENVFLQADKTAVLCTLQQGWLTECLFKPSPELLEDFTVEVVERSAMMAVNPTAGDYDGDGRATANFEAVREVTAAWIAEQTAKL